MPKWQGRCPACGNWNTIEPLAPTATATATVTELSRLQVQSFPRLVLPFAEFNRVLGGGIVPGSLVLIGGEPGIGKSTLLLQIADQVARQGEKVVYISGEESPGQIKLRAERLGVKGDGLFLLPETSLEAVLEQLDNLSPRLSIVDSIQTIYSADTGGAPGSLAQVRECTLKLMRWAKTRSIPMLLAGHVTKEGAIAGPKALEHIVDAVLYLEGETFSNYRLLRGVKNRFGSTQEVGVLEMRSGGLAEVENPSQVFLSQHSQEGMGCAIVPTLEGTRPLLVEVQALTTPATMGPPRRIANGMDFSRLLLLAAVLSKRAGLPLGSQDIIVNVVGGLSIQEPAADLAIALAIASSFRDAPLWPGLVAVGEVGLTGELRPVPGLERRLAEAARLGFKRCLAPPQDHTPAGEIELIPVATLGQALKLGLKRKKGNEGD